jgi:hypothetical protein
VRRADDGYAPRLRDAVKERTARRPRGPRSALHNVAASRRTNRVGSGDDLGDRGGTVRSWARRDPPRCAARGRSRNPRLLAIVDHRDRDLRLRARTERTACRSHAHPVLMMKLRHPDVRATASRRIA